MFGRRSFCFMSWCSSSLFWQALNQDPCFYDPATVLSQFPYNHLYEERAILLGKEVFFMHIFITFLQLCSSKYRYHSKWALQSTGITLNGWFLIKIFTTSLWDVLQIKMSLAKCHEKDCRSSLSLCKNWYSRKEQNMENCWWFVMLFFCDISNF